MESVKRPSLGQSRFPQLLFTPGTRGDKASLNQLEKGMIAEGSVKGSSDKNAYY